MLEPMKVVHLDTALDLRGGQVQLLILARGLRQRGHQQLIVCPEGSALKAQAGSEDFEVFDLPAHDPGCWNGAFQLRQKLLADSFDVVHSHDGKGQTLAWLATAGTAARRVASRRVTFLPRARTSRYGLHHLKYGLTCHGIVAVSKYIQELLVDSGIPGSKIEVIPDAADPPAELPPAEVRAEVRAGWGFPESAFVAGLAGAFAPEKGHGVAIEATILLKGRFPELRLLLAGGEFPKTRRLDELLSRAGDRVRVLGRFQDLAAFFPGLDLYLMPSRAEGLGSSALQAMGYAVPVVASRVGGLPEIVEEGQTGWLVPPDSPPALAETILAAAADRDRLRRYGAKARAKSWEFRSEVMIARTEAFYERILAARPHRQSNGRPAIRR